MPSQLRIFTLEELSQYNGENGALIYIACQGKVYDVSGSFLWQGGRHQVIHLAGRDLTGELPKSPHGSEVLAKFKVMGVLQAAGGSLRFVINY